MGDGIRVRNSAMGKHSCQQTISLSTNRATSTVHFFHSFLGKKSDKTIHGRENKEYIKIVKVKIQFKYPPIHPSIH